MISEEAINKAFALIEAAALKDERAPQNDPFGPLDRYAILQLYRRGMVRGEIYTRNWRRFTLLTGPNKGRKTKAPPYASKKPWKVIDGRGAYRMELTAPRVEPSKPRALARKEIESL